MDQDVGSRDDDVLQFVVPLRNRLKASALIVAVFVVCVVFAAMGASVVLWLVAVLCLPIMLVQLVELFRGASLEIGPEGVRTIDALGRSKYFEFSECSAFDVWSMRQGRNRIELVIFDYSGSEKTGRFSKQNKRFAGYNASLKAAFGLSAKVMADLMNQRRLQAVRSSDQG